MRASRQGSSCGSLVNVTRPLDPIVDPIENRTASLGCLLSVKSTVANKKRPRAARGVRASTWAGRWTHRRWAKGYLVGVEDPFDASDNCARSIAPAALPRMVATFAAGADVLQAVPNERGAPGSARRLFLLPRMLCGTQSLCTVGHACRDPPTVGSLRRRGQLHAAPSLLAYGGLAVLRAVL
jgi:hypothetical protein